MISAQDVSKLREETQAPVMECKRALEETQGDFEKAKIILKKKGELRAEKKQENVTHNGVIASYVHANNKVGALVELRCETDFVANNSEFKTLAHDLALQIVALNPQYLSPENIPAEDLEKRKEEYRKEFEGSEKKPEMIEKIIQGKLEKDYQELCLVEQTFVKDETKKVKDLIKEATAKFGEKVEIVKFCRLEI